jgi:hypothetical protein
MTINLELREVGRSGGLASATSWIGGDKASDCWLLGLYALHAPQLSLEDGDLLRKSCARVVKALRALK